MSKVGNIIGAVHAFDEGKLVVKGRHGTIAIRFMRPPSERLCNALDAQRNRGEWVGVKCTKRNGEFWFVSFNRWASANQKQKTKELVAKAELAETLREDYNPVRSKGRIHSAKYSFLPPKGRVARVPVKIRTALNNSVSEKAPEFLP